jgi:SPP1 family predicted phage head-tail adaptor
MLPAGVLREVVIIERPVEVRNAVGESVQEWTEHARCRAGVEEVGYYESQRMNQVGGSVSHVVRIRFCPGISGAMRVRWVSRDNRMLYISGVVERGRREEHELTCEERA